MLAFYDKFQYGFRDISNNEIAGEIPYSIGSLQMARILYAFFLYFAYVFDSAFKVEVPCMMYSDKVYFPG